MWQQTEVEAQVAFRVTTRRPHVANQRELISVRWGQRRHRERADPQSFAQTEYKYSCTRTRSPGEADLAKENNYQAPTPANRLRLGTSSSVDYIFSIIPLSAHTCSLPSTNLRPFAARAQACERLPDDPTSIQLLNCLDVETGGGGRTDGRLWLPVAWLNPGDDMQHHPALPKHCTDLVGGKFQRRHRKNV